MADLLQNSQGSVVRLDFNACPARGSVSNLGTSAGTGIYAAGNRFHQHAWMAILCQHRDNPETYFTSLSHESSMTAQFVTQRRVEFSHTDMAGIIHFSNYYFYMEEAEHEFFRSLGLSIMKKQSNDVVIGWPRVSANCTFEAPARFEDVLDVHVNVERKGVKSLTIRYEFFRGEIRVAHGRMKTACCFCRQDASLESIPIPPEYDSVILESGEAFNE